MTYINYFFNPHLLLPKNSQFGSELSASQLQKPQKTESEDALKT